MSTSLLNLVDNLSDRLHSGKWTNCKSYLDYMLDKGDQLIFRCFECKKNYKKDFDKHLIKDLQRHMNSVMETFILLSQIYFVIKKKCLSL